MHVVRGAQQNSVHAGGIAAELIAPGVISCRAWGHLRRAHAAAAQSEIERIADGRAHAMLYDGSAIESFEPGLPVVWVRWSLAREPRPRRVAVLGRPGPMLAIATTFRYLLPGLPVALFVDRETALAFLAERDPGEP